MNETLYNHFLWRLLVTTLSFAVIVVHPLPVGFIDEGVGVGTEEATVGKFVPNPRKNGKPMLIVVAKDGPFFVFEDPDTSDTRISIGNMEDIICTSGPRGILNIEPHPDFATNQYIYVWYTRIAPGCPEDAVLGPSNRLSRFTIDEITLELNINSEVVLLETSPSFYAIHDGGAMTIGHVDRLIYLAIGDGGSLKRGQEMNTLNGKMLRLTLNGDVPATNPYTTASGGKGVNCRDNKGRPPTNAPAGSVCEEIYAVGFRNPYRMGYDMNTVDRVRFAVGDVGNAIWEDLSYGGTDYIGKNYGWAINEGPCERNSITVCPLPTANDTDPFYYYQHDKDGGAVTGAVFVPSNIWPPEYKFMFVEYVEGKIMNLSADDSVGCRTCTPPRPSFRNETFHEYERILDISFGPYNGTKQAMYYISRRTEGQNIRRIRYVGGTNRRPQAIILGDQRTYLVNESIAFVGSSSFDPDGDKLKYSWTFGDGRTSVLVNNTITYRKLGTYRVELIVTDTIGLTSKASTTIVVGTPPTAKIVKPKKGTQFQVGEVFRLVAQATDSTTGMPLNDTQLLWEVRLRHDGHYHPFLSQRTGNKFDLSPAPQPEDFIAATNSYLVLVLIATDSNGLSTTVRRNINPKKVLIDIDSNPPGLKVLVGDFNVVTPKTIVAWQNQNLKLEVEDQGSFVFDSWNIGGPRERTFLVPPVNTTNPRIVAVFREN